MRMNILKGSHITSFGMDLNIKILNNVKIAT